MEYPTIISIIIILCFGFLGYLFLIKKQNQKLNWALFYAVLWISVSLPITNYICVEFNLWSFTEVSIIKIPFNLYFLWGILWGIVPFYFCKGKYLLLLMLSILWLDLILMPQLVAYEILQLKSNWILGEILLITIVFLPSYLWAKYSYLNTNLKLRAIFQVIIMTLLIMIIIPFVTLIHTKGNFNIGNFNSLLTQIVFIIAFPSLIAVIDLVEKGLGTPFPYDATKTLVQSGVYAYCKNPIQWSFTFLFIPVSIHYESPLLLIGSVISVLYAIGVSNPQEYNDMENRFPLLWMSYKKKVPSWYFNWKPYHIPKGSIYFKKDCNQCEQIKHWFESKNTINLDIKYSDEYKKTNFLQVTSVHHTNLKYQSVKAIAHGLEHINLAYACVGWFIRFPLISYLLQAIINTMDFDNSCETK